MPVLSVVSPVFNQARWISQALDSVAGLATPHEHLVIDGGSSDGTVDLLAARSDPQLKWISEPDRGQTHAVNKGLERATGDYVGWLNGDDAYVPEAIDRAIAHLERSPEVMAVCGGVDYVDSDGLVRRSHRVPYWSWRRLLIVGDYIPTPTFIYRRELLERTWKLDEQWRDAADYDFFLRLLKGVRVDVMDEALVRFRFHPESKTASNPQLQLDEGLAIRQRWARGSRDRALFAAIQQSKWLILPRISAWPEPWPVPWYIRAMSAAAGLRSTLTKGR